jgi:hypothetical protein
MITNEDGIANGLAIRSYLNSADLKLDQAQYEAVAEIIELAHQEGRIAGGKAMLKEIKERLYPALDLLKNS